MTTFVCTMAGVFLIDVTFRLLKLGRNEYPRETSRWEDIFCVALNGAIFMWAMVLLLESMK